MHTLPQKEKWNSSERLRQLAYLWNVLFAEYQFEIGGHYQAGFHNDFDLDEDSEISEYYGKDNPLIAVSNQDGDEGIYAIINGVDAQWNFNLGFPNDRLEQIWNHISTLYKGQRLGEVKRIPQEFIDTQLKLMKIQAVMIDAITDLNKEIASILDSTDVEYVAPTYLRPLGSIRVNRLGIGNDLINVFEMDGMGRLVYQHPAFQKLFKQDELESFFILSDQLSEMFRVYLLNKNKI